MRNVTPNGIITWQYGDYAEVGTADNPKRVPQTMTKLSGGLSSSLTFEEMDYQYDSRGRLTGSGFAQTPYTGFTPSGSNPWYDSSNPAQSRARAFYAFDGGGRTIACEHYWEVLTSGTTTYGTPTTITQNDCIYDPVLGLKTTSANYVPTMTPSTWTDSYTYDPQLDYLASATYGTNPTVSWTYDAAGNRTDSVCDNLNRTTSIGGVSTTCDVLGNRTALGTSTSYAWDVLNRMTGLTNSTATSSYVYRADGMRTHKTVGSVNTEYYHDGQMPMEDAVISGTTLTATRYGLGARGIDYEEEGVGTWTNSTTRAPGSFSNVGYPIYDAHGNMIATLARYGSNSYAVNNQRTYDAWGAIRSGAGTGDPKNRYCGILGHQQDDESGLIYMRSRYCESGSGRFISQDPDTAGKNWYVYCNSDPINLDDSNGKIPGLALLGILLAISIYLFHPNSPQMELVKNMIEATAIAMGAIDIICDMAKHASPEEMVKSCAYMVLAAGAAAVCLLCLVQNLVILAMLNGMSGDDYKRAENNIENSGPFLPLDITE